MKPSLSILVILIMLFSFTACSAAPDAAAATESPAETAVPTAEPPATPSPTPEPTPTPEPKPGQPEYEAGLLLYNEDSMEEAIASFTASVDLGYAKAAEQLGSMYYDGFYMNKDDWGSWKNDFKESKKWYAKAMELWQTQADQGDADAQYNLGRLYDYGYGVPRDAKKAAELFALAAAQGHAGAQKRLAVYTAPTGSDLEEEIAKLPLREFYYIPQLAQIHFLVYRNGTDVKVAMTESSGKSWTVNEQGVEIPFEIYEGFDEFFYGSRIVNVPGYESTDGSKPGDILKYPMEAAEDYKALELLKIIPSYQLNDLYDYLDISVPEGGLYEELFGQDGRYGVSNGDQRAYYQFCFNEYPIEMYRTIYIDLIPAEYRVNQMDWTNLIFPGGGDPLADVSAEDTVKLGVVTPDTMYNAMSEAVVFSSSTVGMRIMYTYSVDTGEEIEVHDRFTEQLLFISGKDESNEFGVDINNIHDNAPFLAGAKIEDYTNMVMITNYCNPDYEIMQGVFSISSDGSINPGMVLYSNADWAKIYLLLTPESMRVYAADILN
ncbi:MAG TPA: tetratricopeptide repeat protein [Feifaniaceae bacterium]|nr:tetratricopeptide repeat protein [Feifaniaceae bacterium]